MDNQIGEQIHNIPDEQLLEMLSKTQDYTPEAIILARQELETRGGETSLRAKISAMKTAMKPKATLVVSNGQHKKINIRFVPSFFLTNTFQGKGHLYFYHDHLELNGRMYSPIAIGLTLLLFLPAGIIPGILLIYFFCRKRRTIKVDYDTRLTFTKLTPETGVLSFCWKQWKTIITEIRMSEQDLACVAELLTKGEQA